MSANAAIDAGKHGLLVGPGFFFDTDDSLQLTAWNSLANVVLTISGRFLRTDGTIEAFVERHVPNTNRTASSAIFPRGCGWLTDLSIIASGAAPLRGQTFVRVDVVRGTSSPIIVLSTIAQGYVTATKRLAYPGSVIEDSVTGAGAVRSITGTDPAAGAEISETVPTGARWRFLSLRAIFVTDVTAANRAPVLTFDDGTNAFAGAANSVNQAASGTFTYHFGNVGANHANSSPGVMVSTPANLLLLAGYRMRTITGSIQAGDNWGAPQYLVEEFLEAA